MLTAEELLNGYYNGIFPMADSDGVIYWYSPDPRAIIPIENYKPSKSLKPILNKNLFQIRINHNFKAVMQGCAKARFEGDETWISDEIINAYCKLNEMGFAISIEAYQNEKLVGGLYGIALGRAYFGESMFHVVPNASKVAFHYLIDFLKENQFNLLDTQFMNDNVKRFGAIEIPRIEYIKLLKAALSDIKILEEIIF